MHILLTIETDEDPPHTSPIRRSIDGGREKHSLVWPQRDELFTAMNSSLGVDLFKHEDSPLDEEKKEKIVEVQQRKDKMRCW